MNLDRDLRDALRPLGGDPVADAKRVLEALPRQGSPWWRVAPWLGLGLGLVAGLASGFWLARTTATPVPVEPPAAAPEQPPKGETPAGQPGGGPATGAPDKEKEPWQDPAKEKRDPFAERSRMLEVMAFGPIEVDEPGVGVQQLEAGGWMTEADTTFRTGESQVGGYVFANDVRLRLDVHTVAVLGIDHCTLRNGRMWMDTGDRGGAVVLDIGLGKATLEKSGGVFTRADGEVVVLALRGTIALATSGGGSASVTANERVVFGADGERSREQLRFVGTETSWMTPMLEMERDTQALHARVKEMVAAFEAGDERAAARRELLKLGSRSVWLLADSVQRNAASDPDYARQAADLIARLVDYRTARYALPLLELDDTRVRSSIFAGVAMATGIDAGTDWQFWADASAEERQRAVQRWIALLDR